MQDIAEAAGVSLATVDRSLNGRGRVSKRTLDHVLETAQRLGYATLVDRIAPANQHCFDIFVPRSTNAFLRLLTDSIEQEARRNADSMLVRMHPFEDFKPDILAAALDDIEHSDGVAMIAPEHPSVREAVRGLASRNIPIATLVTEVFNIGSIGYVGIDNRAAGRLAGQLVGRLVGDRDGAVLLFLGSRNYRGHEEREIGFRDIIGEEFPRLEIIDVSDIRDNIASAEAATRRHLEARDDIVGIYNLAAGNRGIAAALAECPRTPKVVFVGHELTEPSRKLLRDNIMDVAIDQDPRGEARELLALLLAQARGQRVAPPDLIPIQPIFRENLPSCT
ncbi:MAG: LacI family DNA-binding transcriptional regulator [Rhodobiaceae bacterium]|nr:LacI family DNA-binding transcriptional regulator [Rhodobiaceae bacterium]